MAPVERKATRAELSAIEVYRLGKIDYASCLSKMQDFTHQRGRDTVDQCWVVEHDPVFTLGVRGGSTPATLASADSSVRPIPVVQADRGGLATYHGPGQLVVYVMIDLRRQTYGLRELVQHLEQAIINCLCDVGITSQRREGAPGVYVQGAKIASLGLRVSRGCTYHGLSLNVDMDLTPFTHIDPCGLGVSVTQIKEYNQEITTDSIDKILTHGLFARLGLVPASVR